MTRLAIALCLTPLAASAQAVLPCDWQASAWNIAEPWEANTATFAEGAVRIAVLDTIEPAAGAFWLLVLSPPFDEVGGRQCRVVGIDEGIGFAGLALDGLAAEYDPADGLTLRLAAQLFVPEQSNFSPATLSITLNQASGEIGAGIE